MVAEAALQEDVDVIGLSILSGAHMALVPRVLELLKANEQEHVRVFLGGIIPDEDVPRLMEVGVVGVYGPGTSTEDIIRDVRQAVLGTPTP
jgi:methylmalonyl-CoA mutase C-terminal domain/subunit